MKPMHVHRRQTKGFTVVELVVVIAIIAIITVFGIPSYKSVITQNRMAGEINDLATDVELARSAAVKQGLTVTICPSTDPTVSPSGTTPSCTANTEWNTGWIVFTDVSGNQTFNTNTGDVLLHAHGPFTGTDTLVSTSTKVTLQFVTFNRMGGTGSFSTSPTDANTGTLTLHDATNNVNWRRCVQLSEAGTITVNSPQNSTQSQCP
ncbi:prepilin-type N-terminal cleavage/methylation domain-containing protein [Dyella sp. M7H15-1]|uniref:GspH/FimT family pseudopilin n=1 Tax=Dyella sp. M7H15-1 TaxID=2501295 RepID=UPI001005094D|nr:GspH/FimT family pseudopilin [Dyella sp. M7H15-1]QAU25465.1 prepilin-type N-terminal cleavage/methylation domain-containing protein [Dyella sp. M7H15-1]